MVYSTTNISILLVLNHYVCSNLKPPGEHSLWLWSMETTGKVMGWYETYLHRAQQHLSLKLPVSK